jgi:hypothetical protein
MQLRMHNVDEDARALSREGVEVWRWVRPEYRVSNLGRVFSALGGGKFLVPKKAPAATYVSIALGVAEEVYVHALMLEAFDGPCPLGARGRRIDAKSDPTDVRLHLWEWRRSKRRDLPEEVIEEIKRRFAAGGISQRQLALEYGVAPSYLSMLIRGKIGATVDGPTGTPDVVRGLLPSRTAIRMLVDEDARALAREGVEVWKPIPTFEERYLVSNLGRVIFVPWWRALRTQRDHAYTGLILSCGDGTTVRTQLHRVMLITFDGIPAVQFDRFGMPVPMDGRHLDDVAAHNTLDNLAWGTRAENIADLVRNQSLRRGSAHWRSSRELTEADVEAALGTFAAAPTSVKGFASLLGVTKDVALPILEGTAWTHVPRPENFESAIAGVIRGKRQRRFTEAELSDIKTRLRAGESPSVIARTYDTSPQAIAYYQEGEP